MPTKDNYRLRSYFEYKMYLCITVSAKYNSFICGLAFKLCNPFRKSSLGSLLQITLTKTFANCQEEEIFAYYSMRGVVMLAFLFCVKVMVKVSPIQAMKVHGDVHARVLIFTASRGRVVSPTLGRLCSRESPDAHFTGDLIELREQSEHQVAKKKSTSRNP